MHPRIEPPATLLNHAARQDWVVTTAQAETHGMRRAPVERLLEAGHWQRLTDGIYYLRPGPAPWVARAWAGVLLGGPNSRLGGAAAGHLHTLTPEPPRLIEVLVPDDLRRRDRDGWSFTREAAGLRHRSVGSPPRTCLEDAVLDLCARCDEVGVVDLLTKAIQTRRTSEARLRRRLAERPRLRGRRLLQSVLADVGQGAHSPLELAYLRDVERGHGLPRGRRQVGAGATVRDVVYDDFATIVELDGRLGHVGTGRHRDMDRDNRSTVSGAATLRFGWHDVLGRACAAAAMVAVVLQQRGWPGIQRACRCCHQQP